VTAAAEAREAALAATRHLARLAAAAFADVEHSRRGESIAIVLAGLDGWLGRGRFPASSPPPCYNARVVEQVAYVRRSSCTA